MFRKILSLIFSSIFCLTSISSVVLAEEVSSSPVSSDQKVTSTLDTPVVATTTSSVETAVPQKKSTTVAGSKTTKCGVNMKCATVMTKKAPVDLSKLPCDIPKTVFLKKGVSDGASYSVTKLQTALVKAGYLSATPNGYFGPATYSAVRKLQAENSLLVTGIVGPYSLAKVNEILCSEGGISLPLTTSQASSTEKKLSAENYAETSGVKPQISLFAIKTNADGVQTYDASITNADSISIKAECPPSVVEVTSLVGLTKQKIDTSDSVCTKEKYLYAGDFSGKGVFERKGAPLTFIDRDAVSSWFALDAGATSYVSLPYTLKVCAQNVCLQKKLSVEVRDFFQKVESKQLSIDSFMIDSTKKTFSAKAYNFSHMTIRPGCPYTVQSVDSTGVALSDDASPCNVEKDVVADSTTVTSSYEKTEEKLSGYGFNFILKPVDGSYSDYATVELTLKACTGVQAESVSSTTLRCVEKKGFLTVKDRVFTQASTTSQ